jgi:hypothetical protein
MHSGWDCTSPGYLAAFAPQFAPYDADLARELVVREGDIVLSSAGPEAIALARAAGEGGAVHCVDDRETMRALCKDRVAAAGLETRVAILSSVRGPYDAVALVNLADAPARLRALRDVIAPNGKVGWMLWGPGSEDDPERIFARAIEAVAPEALDAKSLVSAVDRGAMSAAFEAAGLALVRHTVVSHALVFPSAERFARSLVAARAYGARLARLGEERVAAVLARFYERVSGQDALITYAPAATIAVGGLPGAELELPHRPSVRIPAVKVK